MYPLGVLFGLGFDTATEVGLLAISAGVATHHVPFLGGAVAADPVRRRHVPDGHGRRRLHEPGVRLGVLEPGPQGLLQHHRHDALGHGRARWSGRSSCSRCYRPSSRSPAGSGTGSTASTSAHIGYAIVGRVRGHLGGLRRRLEEGPDRGALGRDGRGRLRPPTEDEPHRLRLVDTRFICHTRERSHGQSGSSDPPRSSWGRRVRHAAGAGTAPPPARDLADGCGDCGARRHRLKRLTPTLGGRGVQARREVDRRVRGRACARRRRAEVRAGARRRRTLRLAPRRAVLRRRRPASPGRLRRVPAGDGAARGAGPRAVRLVARRPPRVHDPRERGNGAWSVRSSRASSGRRAVRRRSPR